MPEVKVQVRVPTTVPSVCMTGNPSQCAVSVSPLAAVKICSPMVSPVKTWLVCGETIV